MSRHNTRSESNIYIVKSGDSLMSVAAHFGNFTPTQLARFNHLGMLGVGSPHLFPGQKLYLPIDQDLNNLLTRTRSLPGSAHRVEGLTSGVEMSASRHSTPPLQAEPREGQITVKLRNRSAAASSAARICSLQEDFIENSFLKIRVKRILLPSKLSVDGVLVVRPDSVCFNVFDPEPAPTDASMASRASYLRPEPRHSTSHRSREATRRNGEAASTSPSHVVHPLSVFIPIDRLVSFSTHRHLEEVLLKTTPKQPVSISLTREQSHYTEESASPLSMIIEDCSNNYQEEISGESMTSREHRHETLNAERCAPQQTLLCSPSCDETEEALPTLSKECTIEDPLTHLYLAFGVTFSYVSLQEKPVNEETTEPNSSDIYVFLIPFKRLGDIFRILFSALNSTDISKGFTPQQLQPHALSPRPTARVCSLIETALEEMKEAPIEVTLKSASSNILNAAMLHDLSAHLPAFCSVSTLSPVFSSHYDGYSLANLYRKNARVGSYILLLLRDTTGITFGAILSESMHTSSHFYGTGESCVFHWKPHFKRYDWAKTNNFFMRGASDCFLVGAKSGHNAIWFDSALKNGRSEATDTFNNPVLCGHNFEDQQRPDSVIGVSAAFVIDQLEVWEFVG